jgi:hypothetical protein
MWYAYHHSMVEDIDVQKRGIVWVIYLVQSGHADPQAAWKVPKLMTAMPVRKVAIHVCFDLPKFRALTYFAMLVSGQRGKTHVWLHFGEFWFLLVQFGQLGVAAVRFAAWGSLWI